jgi:hypothetical protein
MAHKIRSYDRLLLIVSFIKFSFLAILAVIFIYLALQDEYFDFLLLNIGIIVGLYYFIATYRYFVISKIAIDFEDTKLSISYLIKYFNTCIDYVTIQSYTQIKKRNLYRETETSVILKLKKGNLIIFDFESDYDDLISKLNENNIPVNKNFVSPFKITNYLLITYALITILTSIYGSNNYGFGTPKTQDDLMIIDARVDTIKKNTYHRDYSSISIKLKGFPVFDFTIFRKDLDEKKADELIAEKRSIDTLFIDINKKEYDIKLAGNIEAGFFQKHWMWSQIKVYGLKTSKKIYFSKFQNSN